MEDGVVVLAHGSRGESGKGEVQEVLQRIAAGLKPLLANGVEIIGASLQFNHPNLEEAVAILAAKGVKQIVIAPYFLFAGRHITEDIPQLMGRFGHTYPAIQFLLANHLGLDKYFIKLIARRIKETAPDFAPRTYPDTVSPIEKESMKILADLLPASPFSKDEMTIIKRIVHACGDAGVVPLIRFSQSAVSAGLNAIAQGSPIFTDVHMLTAGISERLTEFFGCPVSCALDEVSTAEPVGEENTTRTAAAMTSLGERLSGSIAAIGNAPTALLALLDLIDRRKIRPALVVGMPVGFVQADESKQELMKRDVPYITVTGTRGGSAMAAATVNSLLRIAAENYGSNKSRQKGAMS